VKNTRSAGLELLKERKDRSERIAISASSGTRRRQMRLSTVFGRPHWFVPGVEISMAQSDPIAVGRGAPRPPQPPPRFGWQYPSPRRRNRSVWINPGKLRSVEAFDGSSPEIPVGTFFGLTGCWHMLDSAVAERPGPTTPRFSTLRHDNQVNPL
jgi:hypothetical protein